MPEGQDRKTRFAEIAMTVRNRDAGRCRRCGDRESGEKQSVHHLVPDSDIPEEFDAHLPVNLVTLCRHCHSVMEAKSLSWQLQEINIEDQSELMLSEEEREKLNTRLEEIGPDILNVKQVTKIEAEEFIEYYLSTRGSQTDLSDF